MIHLLRFEKKNIKEISDFQSVFGRILINIVSPLTTRLQQQKKESNMQIGLQSQRPKILADQAIFRHVMTSPHLPSYGAAQRKLPLYFSREFLSDGNSGRVDATVTGQWHVRVTAKALLVKPIHEEEWN